MELAVTSTTSSEATAKRFFIPGPTEVHPAVLRAMNRDIVSHRGPEIRTIIEAIQSGIQPVLGTTRPAVISTSSGTGLMEAAVLNGVRAKLLALVNGAFSERFAAIGEACGFEVDRLTVPWGEAHDPEAVSDAVRAHGPDAVSFVQNETSTAVLQDCSVLTTAIRAASDDVVILVDSVSGAGGVELLVDPWGIDFLATAGHKALALPPGIAFGAASERMMGRSATAPRKGFYFDLERFMKSAARFETPTTPVVSVLYAAQAQLDRIAAEGLERRLARHLDMARSTWTWADNHGLEVLAPEGFRSPTVSCVALPDGRTAPEVAKAMTARGYTIATGYGKLKETHVRIGHMGEHSIEGVEAVLAELAAELRL